MCYCLVCNWIIWTLKVVIFRTLPHMRSCQLIPRIWREKLKDKILEIKEMKQYMYAEGDFIVLLVKFSKFSLKINGRTNANSRQIIWQIFIRKWLNNYTFVLDGTSRDWTNHRFPEKKEFCKKNSLHFQAKFLKGQN